MRPLRILFPAITVAAVLIASACGSSSDRSATTAPSTTTTIAPGTSSTTSRSTTSTTSSSATSASTTSATSAPGATTTTPADDDGGIDPMVGANTDPKTGTDPGSGTALLDDVRVARHEGFDRVVFQFRNHVPGYRVAYVDLPVRADGSGAVVPLQGAYAIGVHLTPASGVDMNGAGPSGYEETYTGPKRIDAGTSEITEVAQVGDYEAVLTWAIGTRDRADFRVVTLSNPPRLVVDVRNH